MKKQNKSQKTLIASLVILSLFAQGCARIKLRDERFCGDKGSLGSTCFYDLSAKKEVYNKIEWDRLRFGWICSHPDTFTRRQTALLQFCEETGRCTEEEVEEIVESGKKIQAFKRQLSKEMNMEMSEIWSEE